YLPSLISPARFPGPIPRTSSPGPHPLGLSPGLIPPTLPSRPLPPAHAPPASLPRRPFQRRPLKPAEAPVGEVGEAGAAVEVAGGVPGQHREVEAAAALVQHPAGEGGHQHPADAEAAGGGLDI